MKRFLLVFTLLALAAMACSLVEGALDALDGKAGATPPILADSFFSGYAFIDANGNKRIDADDPPLQGATFTLAGFSDTTNERGMAFITIPGGWEQPVTAQMRAPENGDYSLIGPAEVILQSPKNTRADFLFAPYRGRQTPSPGAGLRLANGEYDLTYCVTSDGVELKMDLYLPENQGQPDSQVQPAPLVIYVHGGGWVGGDKGGGIGLVFARRLIDSGYAFASINYRLSPDYQFPAHIEDVRCAVRHLRAEAERYHIDPERIGALGSSAGGHLAALLGLADDPPPWHAGDYLQAYAGQSSRVAAVVDLFGPADLSIQFELSQSERITGEQVFGAAGNDNPTLALYSPVGHAGAGDPPFLIIHGENDDIVPPEQSRRLYEALISAGIPAELVMVANSGHGLERTGGGAPDPGLPKLQQMVRDFFDQTLF